MATKVEKKDKAEKKEKTPREIPLATSGERKELEKLVKAGRGDLESALNAGARIGRLAADAACTVKEWVAKNLPSVPYPTISAMVRTAKVATAVKSEDSVTPMWAEGNPLPEAWVGLSENALRTQLGTGGVPTEKTTDPEKKLDKAVNDFVKAWKGWAEGKLDPQMRTKMDAIWGKLPQAMADLLTDVLAADGE